MKSIKQMSREEVRRTLEVTAWGLAKLAYKQREPNCEQAEAEQWADENWQEFEDKAVDFLALLEARREADAAGQN